MALMRGINLEMYVGGVYISYGLSLVSLLLPKFHVVHIFVSGALKFEMSFVGKIKLQSNRHLIAIQLKSIFPASSPHLLAEPES